MKPLTFEGNCSRIGSSPLISGFGAVLTSYVDEKEKDPPGQPSSENGSGSGASSQPSSPPSNIGTKKKHERKHSVASPP